MLILAKTILNKEEFDKKEPTVNLIMYVFFFTTKSNKILLIVLAFTFEDTQTLWLTMLI